MSSKSLRIVKLSRLPKFYDGDELQFSSGVNVLAGEKDAGKTKWLRMLDYLLGDTGTPEDAFGKNLAERYESIKGVIAIDGVEVVVERRWKEAGNRGKVFMDGVPVNAADFSSQFLTALSIPVLHFPKGNPYDDRAWPELSWRSLYRHIYRQERFWSDFAERQPTGEQHACLAQFLNVATVLYPEKYGELVRKQKELMRLQAQKENFAATLQMVTRELVDQREMQVAVTDDAIDSTEKRLNDELKSTQEKRRAIFDSIRSQQQEVQDQLFQEISARKALTENQINELLQRRQSTVKRLNELGHYSEGLNREMGRVQRLKSSGELFADLKVTQCPVCDQAVTPIENSQHCYLCGKSHPQTVAIQSAMKRLDFEENQLSEEKSELEELMERLTAELDLVDSHVRNAKAQIRQAEDSLAPARYAAASMLPPDLELLTEHEGRIKEQLSQLERVRDALQQQKELSDKLTSLAKAEDDLRKEIESETPSIDAQELGRKMQDGMNNYLNIVAKSDSQRWPYGMLTFFFGERSFSVKVNGRRWDTQLGATSQALVLFAYHYALLSLKTEERFNYPGLVIVDFPVELMDSKSIGDGENYLVEPFIELCEKLGSDKVQFIAAGRAFLGLNGAHRIKLDRSPFAEENSAPEEET